MNADVYKEQKGLADETGGYKTLNIEDMQGLSVPEDFEIDSVFGDLVIVTPTDENDSGEVIRNGIWLKVDVTKKMWRRGVVVKTGPLCKDVKEGDVVSWPHDRGITMLQGSSKRKYIFLNMERLFCKLKKKKSDAI